MESQPIRKNDATLSESARAYISDLVKAQMRQERSTGSTLQFGNDCFDDYQDASEGTEEKYGLYVNIHTVMMIH